MAIRSWPGFGGSGASPGREVPAAVRGAGANGVARKRRAPGAPLLPFAAARAAVWRLALSGLLAVSALPGLAGLAHAEVLVSNQGQATRPDAADYVTDGVSQAQRFDTGSNAAGYDLTSVEVDVASIPDTPADVTASIHSLAQSGNPGAQVFALANPATFSVGANVFTAPSGATLSADTGYFVVVAYGGTDTTDFTLNLASSDDEDPGGATGWTIDDVRRLVAGTFGDRVFWTSASDSLIIRVNGTATPVAADTTAPMLTSATTTALELKLGYDEALDADSEPAPSAFTVTVDGTPRGVTGVALDETEVVLTLATAVRIGETVKVTYTVPAMNPIRDEARNPAPGFTDHPVTNLAPATAPDAPTNLTATPGNKSVTLRWRASAYNGGSEVTGHQYRLHLGVSAWRDIELSAPGEANATSFTVTRLANDIAYTFDVQAVNAEGASGPSNQARATPTAGDTTAPGLISATTAALELGLTFDENLDAGSEPAPSAFTVTVNGAPRAVTGVSVDHMRVLLTLASAVRAGETVTVSYTPGDNPLRDEARNPAAPITERPVTNLTPATVPDAPTGLDATPGDGSVTLRWTASAHDGGSEVTSHQYRLKTTAGFGSWQDIELSAPGEANATSFLVTSLMNGTEYTFEVQARNEEGASGPSNQESASPVAPDTTAPVLQSASTTALTIELFYDEDLDGGSEPAPSAFTVTVDGAPRAVTGVAVDGTKVTLTLASAVRAGEPVTVSYTVPMTGPLRDEARNPAAAFVAYPVTNPPTAPDVPTGLDATPGDGSVTLRWTAPDHDGGSEITGYRYRQKTTGVFGDDWEDIPMSAPGETNEGSFTISSGLTNDTTYTFQVQAVNAEGGSGPSNEASATPMDTAPMLQSATTTGLEVGLTYDEDLDAHSKPAPSAFTVTVDGDSRAVTGVTVDGAEVVLTLASAVRAGEPVTVSYTVPMTGRLQDEASNPAAAFVAYPVTNPPTAPDAPTNLEAIPGDGSVTLRWTASAYDGGSAVTSHQYGRVVNGRIRWRLADHRGERAGRDERDQLQGDGAELRGVYRPGTGGERGGRERPVQRGERGREARGRAPKRDDDRPGAQAAL